jgi:hypothetical protein
MLALAAAAGCGGGSKKPAAPRPTRLTPTQQVARTWSAFFDGSTPAATKVALLQNGQKFAPLIHAVASSPLAQQAKAADIKVTLPSATRADVVFTVTLGTQTAATGVTGTAVHVNGKWQVSDHTFCALLRLQTGSSPPVCRGL